MIKKAVFSLTLTATLFAGAFQLMATTSLERSTDMTCDEFCDFRYTACLNRGNTVAICEARYVTCMSNCQ